MPSLSDPELLPFAPVEVLAAGLVVDVRVVCAPELAEPLGGKICGAINAGALGLQFKFHTAKESPVGTILLVTGDTLR
jgi:hypothetical protein